MGRQRIPLADRFWAKVDKSGDCWEWTGTRGPYGYGQISMGGRHGKILATHRLSYEIHKGEIPAGLVIDHICHNKSCVKPSHIRAVTQKQNTENVSPNGRRDNKSSGFRGISWDKRKSRWHASVGHNREVYFVGSFDDLEDAKLAVVEKRIELHTHNDLDRIPA